MNKISERAIAFPDLSPDLSSINSICNALRNRYTEVYKGKQGYRPDEASQAAESLVTELRERTGDKLVKLQCVALLPYAIDKTALLEASGIAEKWDGEEELEDVAYMKFTSPPRAALESYASGNTRGAIRARDMVEYLRTLPKPTTLPRPSQGAFRSDARRVQVSHSGVAINLLRREDSFTTATRLSDPYQQKTPQWNA